MIIIELYTKEIIKNCAFLSDVFSSKKDFLN